MWMERFVIIVGSLERDFLPSSWGGYAPTLIEIATLLGSFGLFFTCFLVFCRLVPVVAVAEVKALVGSEKSSIINEPSEGNHKPIRSAPSLTTDHRAACSQGVRA